ncbi:polysaccharide deacetylase family protein [Actinomyces bowdenii]|uniref:DUF2334 domain-containing protein n=1 Tax=Actinomyces bowdenii TaxID=131109 RepID=UPI001ABD2889|nr:polysaccharide deacetylase family protein [Actinomyces bowdenii]MBO3724324.1 polysaccharide deacetylase family protein [Actinomyces bowdenii]
MTHTAFHSPARRRGAAALMALLLGTTITALGPAQAAQAPHSSRAANPVRAQVADQHPGAAAQPGQPGQEGEAPLPAPPEPEAAAQGVLPLELAGGEQVDLDAPVPAAQAQPALRDLTVDPPQVPANAVEFSTPEAGPADTLVLFDTTGPMPKLGEYYAMAIGTLASHSGTVTALPVKDYQPGLAGNFTNVVYVGSTYDEPLPRGFIDDVLTGNIPVMWSGFNIWQLAATDADRAAFSQRYGWDAATSYIDSEDQVTQVTYNGTALKRHKLNTSGIIAPHITSPQDVTVLGQAQCSGADGAAKQCAPIAQSGSTSFPWAVASSGLTFVGEIPLTYLGEQDRYIAAADILLDVLQPHAGSFRQAAVRLEDISPESDPAQLQAIVDYLHGAGVPFQMAVVPIYSDPTGVENEGTPQYMTLADTPELVAVIKDATTKGGTIVQHGTTHQFGSLKNPYNGVSTDDFEFIRSWCSQVNDNQSPPIDCQPNSWVQIGGALEGTDQAWARERVEQGRRIFTEVGLPEPAVFETPHYSATREAYAGMTEVYPVRYERELLHSGLFTGTPGGPHDYYGQFFPYAVNDPYGTHILPENLGNYEPEAANQHPPRLAADVVDAARANLVGTHATASFFFHPYYPLSELRAIVEGIQAEGYTFVPATELR